MRQEIDVVRHVLNADLKAASERVLTLELENQKLKAANARLLADWREQDRILQRIAAIVGDEHVTCAADVLREVKAFAKRT